MSTHMASSVALGFVSNLPLSNCFGVGKPIAQFSAIESEQAAVQAGLLKLLWNFEVGSPRLDTDCHSVSWGVG